MCSAPKQGQTLPAGVDLEKETVITGRVVDDSGQSVAGAFVRLLDSSDEFTAEVVASATGDFRFFAAPGTWTVRALSKVGNGDATVAPSGAGIHEVDIKVAGGSLLKGGYVKARQVSYDDTRHAVRQHHATALVWCRGGRALLRRRRSLKPDVRPLLIWGTPG